ncbi:carboxypeptidase T [Pilimelia terevasa]|uniref:Zinc carboxypeptidase n=1 Tax=Pilimelia terevasa TaxID=53372 RepID=A0A8J3BN98_9ACTN|nr:M14 family metallopeptidase [Pilimelia terevasa]GGK21524.1 carboxypeptidase T [Pilimelia terevasa]
MPTPARTWRRAGLALTLALGGLAAGVAPVSAGPVHVPRSAQSYVVGGAQTLADRDAVAATGAAIDSIEHGQIYVSATLTEAAAIRRLGLAVSPVAPPAEQGLDALLAGFPANMQKYHDYDEMTKEINDLVAAHPQIAAKSSIGKSHEGRDLPLIKISDKVADDEAEPEVLITSHHHAREHLTVEMALYLMHLLVDNYGKDERVTRIVDSREIWVVPNINPDGGAHDIAGSRLAMWRKTRQPNSDKTYGIDPNRNYGYKWGCCNGSSGTPSSDTYRGTAAFSSTEVSRVRDFVNSRVVGGKQQIKANLDWHSYSELILWPYGYTNKAVEPGLTQDDASTFQTWGKKMAESNGYTPKQASGLYITDGSSLDWLWAEHKIFGYTFEMYPKGASPGFYPPDTVIEKETTRNKEASLFFMETADCPYKLIGKQDQYCK